MVLGIFGKMPHGRECGIGMETGASVKLCGSFSFCHHWQPFALLQRSALDFKQKRPHVTLDGMRSISSGVP